MTPLQRVLRQPPYAILAAFLSMAMLGVYVYTQVLGNLGNVDVWIVNVPRVHAALLLVFAGLFGITMSYQIHLWRSPKTCPVEKQAKGTSVSGIGTIGIFLIAQCPACASLGALFLPLSAITFLTQYAVWINLLSIGLLVFTLHYLGAFTEEK